VGWAAPGKLTFRYRPHEITKDASLVGDVNAGA